MIRSRATLTANAALALSLASFASLGLGLSAGCTQHPLETPKPAPEQQTDLNYEVNPVKDVDLLVVVDNSGSMIEEQKNLETNFKALINKLAGLPGGLPNLHIAVVSSDVGAGNTTITGNPACNRPGGDQGKMDPLTRGGTCGVMGGAGYLMSAGDNKNYTGDLATVFGCVANLGTTGCGYEHQLQSARLALTENFHQANAGFLRENALLAVLFLTDEDDCSAAYETDMFADTNNYKDAHSSFRCNVEGHMCRGSRIAIGDSMAPILECKPSTPAEGSKLIGVQEFVDFFLGLKKDPGKIVMAAISGWPDRPDGFQYTVKKSRDATSGMTGPELFGVEPACVSAGGNAAPAVRMKSFIDSFGTNGSFHSICSNDFTPALERIGEIIAVKLNPGCIEADLVDRDLAMDGIQPECQVADREPLGAGAFNDKPLLRCDTAGGATPCWRLEAPAQQMGEQKCEGNRFRVVVDRGAGQMAPQGISQIVKCATCAKGKGISGCPCSAAAENGCAPGFTCGGGGICAPM